MRSADTVAAAAEPAVAYFVFNRPDATRRSFEAIRARRPTKLFVIADGPRRDRPLDVRDCAEVREVVARIDWPCDVRRVYADSNMGCKARVSSGLDRVFADVDRAIILEDDCVASPDFFAFAAAMLERYADDERVWHVTGGQYWPERSRVGASYYFTKYPHIWGWATWSRAWRHYDGAVPFWPSFRRSHAWLRLMPDPGERRYWERVLDRVHDGRVDSWGYAWVASVWYHGGLTAAPYTNLIENIGFGVDATHTASPLVAVSGSALPLERLVHPRAVARHEADDALEFRRSSWGEEIRVRRSPRGLLQRALRRLSAQFAGAR